MSTTLISALLYYGATASAGALSGKAAISVESYPDIGLASPYSTPFCGMPWGSLDLNRITAVQGLTKEQCGTCLQVCGAKPYGCAYILAVDQGGRHLDLSTGISGSVIGTTNGIAYAEWRSVPARNCAGIHRDDPSYSGQTESGIYDDITVASSVPAMETTTASYLGVTPTYSATRFTTSTSTMASATPTPTEYLNLETPSEEHTVYSPHALPSTVRNPCTSSGSIPNMRLPSQFLTTLEASSEVVTSVAAGGATTKSPFPSLPLPIAIQYDSSPFANYTISNLTFTTNYTVSNLTWTANSTLNAGTLGPTKWINRILAPYNITLA